MTKRMMFSTTAGYKLLAIQLKEYGRNGKKISRMY